MEQEEEKLSTFALFLNKTIRQTKLISHLTVSLLLNTMHAFIYDTVDILKKRDTDVKMAEVHLLVTSKCHFSPAESAPSYQEFWVRMPKTTPSGRIF